MYNIAMDIEDNYIKLLTNWRQGRILLVGGQGQHWGWIIINYSFIGAVNHIKDQRTGLINSTFILGTVLYVWYSQHGCRYQLPQTSLLGYMWRLFKKYYEQKIIILVGPWPPGPPKSGPDWRYAELLTQPN